ncbi:MAG TPA: prolyl oligopeptidase family serine peptidase [Pyrinomonadaceae bacterium]|nr:prolyl oligopeptidase family serine peptidase [Pyrinomonadaceae bacterium]
MRTSHAIAALLLLLCACGSPALAQTGTMAQADGTLIESAPYQLPAHEQLPDNFKAAYAKEAVERMRNSADLELLKIKYLSDGLKVVGFIYKPRRTEGQRLPAIIFNRGGLADGAIGPQNFNYLYEMHRYASEGFVVIASQYRGADGSEGRDEVAGADTDDVMNLIPLARSLGYVDMNRLFMWGYSRGAMMTLQALKRGAPVRAVTVVGAPTDLAANLTNPGFVQFARSAYPGFDERRDETLQSRSAILWVDKIEVPLLILQGGADNAVSPTHAMKLAQKLEEQGKTYELVVYAKDNHGVFLNAEDRLRRTIDWFKNVRTMSIAQVLGRVVREQGAEAAVKRYYELKRTRQDTYDFGERELNTLGYTLLREQRVKEAVEIFKLNVAAYPEGFNTYDSLGEAYLAAGERELAMKNYKKSLELNPQNTNATDALKRLEGQQ